MSMNLVHKLVSEQIPYTGFELRPHFLLQRFGLKGSAMGCFVGPCEVKTGEMVDWEDRLEDDFIRSKLMVHFIGEFFGIPLREGVLMQRIFMAIAADEIQSLTSKVVTRSGDDLFWENKKLSVSIATASPVSALMHVGINWDSEGAPVQAAGLKDLGLRLENTREILIPKILNQFTQEMKAIEWACAKVRPVV
jgi:uncharacterized protein